MVTIVTEYNEGDTQLFEHYWCPLLYKYKDQKVEFIFVDHTSKLNKIMPKVPNVKIENNNKNINSVSKYNNIVFTKIDLVPTYAAMVAFKKMKNNQTIDASVAELTTQPALNKPGLASIDNIIMYKVRND